MIAAGARYFVIVFAVAFAFGTVRTLWITPAIGATAGVLIELPLILAVSWWSARSIVQKPRPMGRKAALATGAIAFALLMVAEALLAVFAFGISFTDWLVSLIEIPGPIGLAGQVAFALMPFIVVSRQSSLLPRR